MKLVATFFVPILLSWHVFANDICHNFYFQTAKLSSIFDYDFFMKKKSDYINSNDLKSILNNPLTPEEKLAFLEALSFPLTNALPDGWIMSDNQKIQKKLNKILTKIDLNRITISQLKKIISLVYKERLSLTFPFKNWGSKTLQELTDEQVIARIEQEIITHGILDAITNLGLVTNQTYVQKFSDFSNRHQKIFEVALSTAFNTALLKIQGITWFTPLAARLPEIPLFDIEKKREFEILDHTSNEPNSQKVEMSLTELFKSGLLNKDTSKSRVTKLPFWTYADHHYQQLLKIHLPLFFAVLWSSIGLNMVHNYGGSQDNNLKDVIVIEIDRSKTQFLKVINAVTPLDLGGQNENQHDK